MSERTAIAVIARRTLLLSGVAAAAAAAFLRTGLALAEDAASPPMERSKQFEEAFNTVVAGAKPAQGLIAVDLPEIAENGNFVPITISVESPMTDADHVKFIHILSTGNPVAKIATFHLSPLNWTARVQSRIRLAKTQDVMILAEMSSGTWAIATQTVKVTIGGCAS
jgi:sulfur-oxidizing protein SoxY